MPRERTAPTPVVDDTYNDTKHIKYVSIGSRQVRVMPGQRVAKTKDGHKVVEGRK